MKSRLTVAAVSGSVDTGRRERESRLKLVSVGEKRRVSEIQVRDKIPFLTQSVKRRLTRNESVRRENGLVMMNTYIGYCLCVSDLQLLVSG